MAELGLPTKGTKAELLDRVEKYIHEGGHYLQLCNDKVKTMNVSTLYNNS